MRVHSVEVGHLQLDLAVTFGVARDIREKVADPLKIAQEAAISARFAAAGINRNAGFEFDVENVPMILWLGAKVHHSDLKLSEIQEACCDIGFANAMQIADGFLAQFIAPRSQEKPEASGEAKPGE